MPPVNNTPLRPAGPGGRGPGSRGPGGRGPGGPGGRGPGGRGPSARGGGGRGPGRGGPGGRGGYGRRPERTSEYQDRVLEIRRVSRVMAGGKRFSFRAAVVVGNRKGKVGLGVAKGLDVQGAIEKARRYAEKAVITIPLRDGRTIAHEVEAKYGAARVRVKPAKAGHGLIAGGSARIVLELVGVRDVSAKIIGTTKNKVSNARATLQALQIIAQSTRIRKPIPPVAAAPHGNEQTDKPTNEPTSKPAN